MPRRAPALAYRSVRPGTELVEDHARRLWPSSSGLPVDRQKERPHVRSSSSECETIISIRGRLHRSRRLIKPPAASSAMQDNLIVERISACGETSTSHGRPRNSTKSPKAQWHAKTPYVDVFIRERCVRWLNSQRGSCSNVTSSWDRQPTLASTVWQTSKTRTMGGAAAGVATQLSVRRAYYQRCRPSRTQDGGCRRSHPQVGTADRQGYEGAVSPSLKDGGYRASLGRPTTARRLRIEMPRASPS